MPSTWDLLIRGAILIEPAQGLSAHRDVGFRDGRVAALAEALASGEAREVVDAAGALVTSGLIDLHAHVSPGALSIGCTPTGRHSATSLRRSWMLGAPDG